MLLGPLDIVARRGLVDRRRSETRRTALHAALGALSEIAPLVELVGAAALTPRQHDSRMCAIA